MKPDAASKSDLDAESPESNINVSTVKDSGSGKLWFVTYDIAISILTYYLQLALNPVARPTRVKIALPMANSHHRRRISQGPMYAVHVGDLSPD